MPGGQRIRQIALLTPLICLLLFLPPYIGIFNQPDFLFGMPVLLIFLFSVWLAGIIVTGYVARRYARLSDWPGTERQEGADRR